MGFWSQVKLSLLLPKFDTGILYIEGVFFCNEKLLCRGRIGDKENGPATLIGLDLSNRSLLWKIFY